MNYSGQVLHSIEVTRLKGVVNLSALELDKTPLTAITGTNGCGKSTLLHALACVYAPISPGTQIDFKFPRFFLPTTDSTWQGSEFKVRHSYRYGSFPVVEGVEAVYRKANDRWTPRYERRPQRHVEYIGIDTCVPSIERERSMSFLELASQPLIDDANRAIRDAASRVLNRTYQSMSRRSGRNRSYRGVEHQGLGYSSLSMGAGEQRVFEIIDRLYAAPRNSLLLIDEVDLLMHEDALRRLISVLHERASSRNLQVVFTTHRESILDRSDITVHHLFQADGSTFAMPAAHPDVWHRLTGDQRRTLEVFVEDDLASAIVSKVAADLGVRKHVQVTPVGAAANLFTLAGGLALRGEDLSNKLVVLDGDVYRSHAERSAQINKVVTGHGARIEALRSAVASSMSMLCLPQGQSPEQYMHQLLVSVDSGVDEICSIARQIDAPMERHGYVDSIVERMGEARAVSLRQIVDCVARSDGWSSYVQHLSDWLVRRCAANSIATLGSFEACADSHPGASGFNIPAVPAPLI